MGWLDRDYTVKLSALLTQAQIDAMKAIPGVRVDLHRGVLRVPVNAAWLVGQESANLGIQGVWQAPLIPRPSVVPPTVAAAIDFALPKIRQGELKPGVLESEFPFQLGGAARAIWMESGFFVWAPGCLAGDTEVVVNRAGGARRMRLDHIAARWAQDPHVKGRQWRADIEARTASLDDDGFLRLNTIVAAYPTGVKPLWRVTTESGKRVKTTAEHRFAVAIDKWVELRDLRVGDYVLMAAEPQAGGRPYAAKLYYPAKGGMWHHPHAARKDHPRKGRPGPRRAAEVPTHRLVVEADINGLDLESFIARVQEGAVEGLTFLDPREWHVHHKDRDTRNYSRQNLEVLSEAAHLRRHAKEGAASHCTARARAERIVAIEEVPPEPTFDMTMVSPHNSYVANGFIVHNSGKTLGAQTWIVSEPGPCVIVTPASVRDSWWRQFARFTELDVHVVDPYIYRRVASEKLPGYLDRMERQRLRPIVIVAWESLVDWLPQLLAIKPHSVIFDESHYGKNPKRVKWVPQADGQKWKARSLDNASWGAAQLSAVAYRRLNLSATPIPDRLRDLWAQLDLVEPGSWGSTPSQFFFRHCEGRPGLYGGIDATGRSREQELLSRWSFTCDRVPYSVSHAQLPPKRRIVTRLPSERQDRPSGASAKEIREALKRGKDHLFAARTLEAASRCRSYMVETAASVLRSGGKVVMLQGMHVDCERLAEEMRKVTIGIDKCQLWTFHGTSHSPRQRFEMREAYMDAPGPAVIVATTEVLMVGNDLHDTDHMLVGHIPWNHGDIWQLENRVSRQGQKRPTTVEYVVPVGTVAEHIVEIVLDKAGVLDTLVPDEALAGLRTAMEGLSDPKALMDSLVARMERAAAEAEEAAE